MRSKHLGFGVFLLTIGIIWLLVNFRLIEGLSILNSLIVLWPLILVVVGVNVIFKHNPVVKLVTWLLFLAVIISYGYFAETKYVENDKDNAVITEEISQETKHGEFNIAMGAEKIELDSKTRNLFDVNIARPVDSSVSYRDGKETAAINFEKKSYSPFNFRGGKQLSSFHLNEDVTWDIKVDTGAVSGRLDMSDLEVEKFSLNMGFGNMDLDFGTYSGKTLADINMGFSNVNAFIPKSSGVRVRMESGLTGSNLKALKWEKQGEYYISPNYDTAESKIDIELKAGLSSFNINLKD